MGMTEQEAKDKCIQSVDFETEELENIVVSALEKQIPKKPIWVEKFFTNVCPICKCGLSPQTIYCNDCGQKLDWGNEDAE